MTERTFTRRDLLVSYVAFVRAGEPDAGPDSAYYRALSAAFGAALESPPHGADGPRPAWLDLSRWEATSGWRDRAEHGAGLLMGSAARSCAKIRTPFDGYLEMPPAIIGYREHYVRQLRRAADELRERHFELMEELLTHVWGVAPDATVKKSDVWPPGQRLERADGHELP